MENWIGLVHGSERSEAANRLELVRAKRARLNQQEEDEPDDEDDDLDDGLGQKRRDLPLPDLIILPILHGPRVL